MPKVSIYKKYFKKKFLPSAIEVLPQRRKGWDVKKYGLFFLRPIFEIHKEQYVGFHLSVEKYGCYFPASLQVGCKKFTSNFWKILSFIFKLNVPITPYGVKF